MDILTSDQQLGFIDDDVQISKKRPRPRPVVSCLECRKRKLKCDRLLPCSQCKRFKRPLLCEFPATSSLRGLEVEETAQHSERPEILRGDSEPPVEERNSNHPRKRVQTDSVEYRRNQGILDDLRARVAGLEHLISTVARNRGHHTLNPSKESDLTQQGASVQNLGYRFHAQYQKVSMMFKFPQVVDFVQNMSQEPTATAALKDVKAAREVLKRGQMNPKSVVSHSSSELITLLRTAVPSRRAFEASVRIYFDDFEHLLRILHRPLFEAACDTIWNQADISIEASGIGIVPQMLLVAVIAAQSREPRSWSHQRPDLLDREAIISTITLWLASLKTKLQNQISTLQTRCLLILTQQVCMMKLDSIANDTAVLVRISMTMGIHIDAKEFANISVCNGELRRRLWATIVELDIQASIMSGCPTIIRMDDSTTNLPSPVHDMDLREDMTQIPESRPGMLFQSDHVYVYLASTQLQRLKILSLAGRTAGEIMEQGDCIESFISECDEHIRNALINCSPSHVCNLAIQSMLIQRAVLKAYWPFVFQNSPMTFASRKMERVCVELSMRTLLYLRYLHPTSMLMLGCSSNQFELYQILCNGDILQATLVLCLAVNDIAVNSLDLRFPRMFTGSVASLVPVLKHTMEVTLQRSLDVSFSIRDMLYLAVIVESVRSYPDPTVRSSAMRTIFFDILKSHRDSIVTLAKEQTLISSVESPTLQTLGLLPTPSYDESFTRNDPITDFYFHDVDDFGNSVDWDWQYSNLILN